jgi:alanine dehydrogenase
MKTFGFPRMLFEKNEKRDFMPDFFRNMKKYGVKLLLEDSYGEKLGLTQKDYLEANPDIEFVSRREAFQCDVVTIIRTPGNDELKQMKNGSALFSMIHFVTHKKRCDLLKEMGVHMYAMDSVVDDFGKRMVEYIDGTANNGITVAANLFLQNNPDARQIRYLVLGSGLVGKTAVDKAVHSAKAPCICTVAGSNTTSNTAIMVELMKQTDILVDSTYRKDTSKIIVPNSMIALLPENAIILDLTADDYDATVDPVQVKGIEGIPTGNLDQYVFEKDDKAFDNIPDSVSSKNRRTTVSCYSWPAVDAVRCLEVYQKQMLPFMKVFADLNFDNIKLVDSDIYCRSLARGCFDNQIL